MLPMQQRQCFFWGITIVSLVFCLHLSVCPAPLQAQSKKAITPRPCKDILPISYKNEPGVWEYMFACDLHNFYAGRLVLDTGMQKTPANHADPVIKLQLTTINLDTAYYAISISPDRHDLIIQTSAVPPGYFHRIVDNAVFEVDSTDSTLGFIGTDDIEYPIVDPDSCAIHPPANPRLGWITRKWCYFYAISPQNQIIVNSMDNKLHIYSRQEPHSSVKYDSVNWNSIHRNASKTRPPVKRGRRSRK